MDPLPKTYACYAMHITKIPLRRWHELGFVFFYSGFLKVSVAFACTFPFTAIEDLASEFTAAYFLQHVSIV